VPSVARGVAVRRGLRARGADALTEHHHASRVRRARLSG
jgi:hypothetical protein